MISHKKMMINATITSFRHTCTSPTTNVHQKVPCKWKILSPFLLLVVVVEVVVIIIVIFIIIIIIIIIIIFAAAAVATDLLLT